MKDEVSYPSDLQLKFSHFLKAPRQLVWDAHADLAMADQWWGPRDFITPRTSAALRRVGSGA